MTIINGHQMTEYVVQTCGECQFRQERTAFYNKVKVFECVLGRGPHYRVGKNATCTKTPKVTVPK